MFGEQPPLGSQELSSGINLTTQSTCLEARSLLIPSGEILLCLYCSMGSGGCRVFSVFWKQTFSCALPHSPSLLGVSHFLQDLHQRIDRVRLTPPLEDSRFHYGFNSNYLKKIISYWRNEFDWRKQVEILNKYPHFKTKIEGMFPKHQLEGDVYDRNNLHRHLNNTGT